MGDLRKQIRRLEGQVEGFKINVMRDFNQRLIKQEKRIEELETKLKKLEGK